MSKNTFPHPPLSRKNNNKQTLQWKTNINEPLHPKAQVEKNKLPRTAIPPVLPVGGGTEGTEGSPSYPYYLCSSRGVKVDRWLGGVCLLKSTKAEKVQHRLWAQSREGRAEIVEWRA